MGRELDIRRATRGDLAPLAVALGSYEMFADRLARQEAGRGLLLVAWTGGHPVGTVYLRLEDAEEPEMLKYLPGVPVLQHLAVHPDHRDRGLGTAIMEYAEGLLRELGHDRLVLGVNTGNEAAERLYRRLRYREWEHGTLDTFGEVFHPDGTVEREPEQCRVFVKPLDGTQGR
jgi:ribosomal protein S18 acetylase RimI-like enzyme